MFPSKFDCRNIGIVMEKVSDYLPGVALISAALVVCGAWIDTAGERDVRDYALQYRIR
jgi:hypothetical protein